MNNVCADNVRTEHPVGDFTVLARVLRGHRGEERTTPKRLAGSAVAGRRL